LGEQIHCAAPLRLFASLTCYKPFLHQVTAVVLRFFRQDAHVIFSFVCWNVWLSGRLTCLIPPVTKVTASFFFLFMEALKNVVIDLGQEIQLLNDKIDCLD